MAIAQGPGTRRAFDPRRLGARHADARARARSAGDRRRPAQSRLDHRDQPAAGRSTGTRRSPIPPSPMPSSTGSSTMPTGSRSTATACPRRQPNGRGLTPARRHDPLAAVDGAPVRDHQNGVRNRSESLAAFIGIRSAAGKWDPRQRFGSIKAPSLCHAIWICGRISA
jgi:hypothetical protein